ncbi:hypothetical protein [Candidatus Nitrosocosmicus arcticus]|uniref:Putative Variant surface antigen A n=1 Tax=Candidatus Nitrosocosmicus arcticus TaxID=2035267 RepID=A0A557SXH6_9ARCH|nr:hypothetical protein [Candidatus Nitrosocosmicus arcticus]TVP41309.1 putative Variant surface antigen A [Candidatus Nitrosocosmicus arcticus]
MKYLSLLLLSVLFIPLVQVAHAQNIIDQIGQAFNNLTSGMMGGNETNQTSSNSSSSSAGSANQTSSNSSSSSAGSANQTSSNSSSAGSANQSSTDVGSFQELQNLTSGNQEMLSNNTSIAGENTSLGQGMEKEQFVETENQSNALASANNTQ